MCCWFWHVTYNILYFIAITIIRGIGPILSIKISRRETILALQDRRLRALHLPHHQQTFLFHAASMGELEQLKPLIRLVRQQVHNAYIVVSVFSPSAWREHPDISYDLLVMLPYDTPKAMNSFFDILHPRVAIISRYDLWWNCVRILNERTIPIILVNATYPLTFLAQLPIARSFLHCLYGYVKIIIARSNRHFQRFIALGCKNIDTVVSDSRIDQLCRILHEHGEVYPFLDTTRIRLVLGSSWNIDHRFWYQVWNSLSPSSRQQIQLIIVPHEPTPQQCEKLLELFPDGMLLSNLDVKSRMSVVIVDKVGMLARLYHHVNAAYIGGGFGRGVHSVLEAAFAGIPVSCGPRIHRSDDALEMQENDCLSIILSPQQAHQWVEELLNSNSLYERSRRYAQVIRDKCGISKYLYEIIQRTISSNDE